jgi:hypothetical protein
MNEKLYADLIAGGIAEDMAKAMASKIYAEPVSGWIEVFRAGTHTATNGTTKTYTIEDLQAMAKLYNDQTDHEAPLVVGHPETNDPAYGWAKKLQVSGDRLQAFVEFVGDKIKSAIDSKMFKKVSIALYGNNLLRHIGLLGAAPPAVKGLAPVEFKSGDEYSEIEISTEVSLMTKFLANIRKAFAKNYSEDELEKIFPKEDCEVLFNSADLKLETKQKQEDEMDDKIKAEFTEQITGLKTTIAELKEQREKDQLEYASGLKKMKLDAESSLFSTFVEGLVKDGKVLAAEVDNLKAEFADIYLANSQLTFSEGQKSLIEKFRDRLSARPVVVTKPAMQWARKDAAPVGDMAEYATFAAAGTVIESSIDTDKEIKKIVAERKVSYSEAAEIYINS